MFAWHSFNLFCISAIVFGFVWASKKTYGMSVLRVFCSIFGSVLLLAAVSASLERGDLLHQTALDWMLLELDPSPFVQYGTMAADFMLFTAQALLFIISALWFIMWLAASYVVFGLLFWLGQGTGQKAG